MRLADHRLRAPVGIGELHERVGVRVFEHRNRIEGERRARLVGDANVLQIDGLARRNEGGDLGADAVKLGDPARVAEPHAALELLIGIERRHEERREHPISRALAMTQVKRAAFELRSGELRNVLADAVERGIPFADEQTSCVVYEPTERQRTHVVDPFRGRLGIGDHVLAVKIVEVAIFHGAETTQARRRRARGNGRRELLPSAMPLRWQGHPSQDRRFDRAFSATLALVAACRARRLRPPASSTGRNGQGGQAGSVCSRARRAARARCSRRATSCSASSSSRSRGAFASLEKVALEPAAVRRHLRQGLGRLRAGLARHRVPSAILGERQAYANYTDRNGDTNVVEWRVSKDDPDRVDPSQEKRILFVEQPYANHNGGDLVFGPDGKLYVGLGDGGQPLDPHGNGQNPSTPLGKMLRIDVDAPEPPSPRWSRSGFAIRGATRSIARPAISTSPTSARTSTRTSTSVAGGRLPAKLRLEPSRGDPLLQGQALRARRLRRSGGGVHALARAARSPAATCTGARPSPSCRALLLRRLLHRHHPQLSSGDGGRVKDAYSWRPILDPDEQARQADELRRRRARRALPHVARGNGLQARRDGEAQRCFCSCSSFSSMSSFDIPSSSAMVCT